MVAMWVVCLWLFLLWYGDLCLLVGLRLSGADNVSGGFGGGLSGGSLG